MAPIGSQTRTQVNLVDSPGGCGAVIRYPGDHDGLAEEYGVITCGMPSQAIEGKRTWFRCQSCLEAGKD